MATLTKEEKQTRERREMGRWESMRDRGEGIQRENRRQDAVKAKEDGVEQRPRDGQKPSLRA